MKKSIVIKSRVIKDRIELPWSGKWANRCYAHFDFADHEGATHIQTLFESAGIKVNNRKYRITIETLCK